MRRLSFRLLAFRFFIAAAAFALGIASANLWPRQHTPQCRPLVVAIRAPSEKGGYDSSEYEACNDDTRVENRYCNYNYGFSVDLPDGMVGSKSPPPAPQHGFGVDLDNPKSTAWAKGAWPKSYLSVDGSYNSFEWEQLDDAVNNDLSLLREEGSNVSVISRTETRLAGLRSVRAITCYEKNGEPMVSDEIVAFRKENGEDVVYTIDLNTSLSNYGRDKPVLEEMQKTWCLQPLR